MTFELTCGAGVDTGGMTVAGVPLGWGLLALLGELVGHVQLPGGPV